MALFTGRREEELRIMRGNVTNVAVTTGIERYHGQKKKGNATREIENWQKSYDTLDSREKRRKRMAAEQGKDKRKI